MRRRDFIKGIVGSAATRPLAARAQQARKLPVIGILGAETPAAWSDWVSAFVQRLHDLGWNEGHNITIEYRWAGGSRDRAADFAREFVKLNVDVILASGSMMTAVKPATSVIPIVFPIAADPVATGFVESLARPGGNITGMSLQSTDAAPKKLQLLREVVPGLRRLAVLADLNTPANVRELAEVQSAARALDLTVVAPQIRQPDDVASAFTALKGQAEALYICPDPILDVYRNAIKPLAVDARLPTMLAFREDVEAGGLMSYGTSFRDLFRRSADLVDKILRGAKPADIPVEQPTKFDLVVNLKTAKALGLSVPASVLAIADEVIE
jgi:putative tryptophan/tyrosine transport system substrate-binding protein